MNEESGSIAAVGAMSSMDDFVSTQDNSPSPQATAALSQSVTAVSGSGPRPSQQAIQSALAQINAHLASVDRVLSLKVDPGSGYTVAQISNATTGQVLQQFPNEDQIQLERMLARWSHGGNVLMDEEA
ncbi:MAG TPA: flagellar protein FlaG [Steroidobacteraceae bacterium]|nr:flagellar protein FlaG [Steroidobacteraceae bacterium]